VGAWRTGIARFCAPIARVSVRDADAPWVCRVSAAPAVANARYARVYFLTYNSLMKTLRLLALAIVPVAVTAAAPGQPLVAHLHLVRSQPAANDTLHTAPGAIRLWFSSPPEMAITTVHLTTATGAAVAVGPVTRDNADTAPVIAPVTGSVMPGAYIVVWRTSAMDGHMSSGTIPFVVGR
jgi:methionine-rich copper-binding protein CopC